jgi:nucleoside-diphosphate-sugar epimerase
MAEGMDGCDVVFHAAAYVDDHGTLAQFTAANVTGTEHTLAAAKRAQVGKFVHVGTEAVLADGNPLVNADETKPYPARPYGNYAVTKQAAEKLALGATNPAFDVVVIRPRFIWGRGDTSLLPKAVEMVKRGKWGWIDGGRQPTSTCHVANVSEGAIAAAEKGKGGEVYFLTDGPPVDAREFITAYIATQGVDAAKMRNIPRWFAKGAASMTGWMKRPPISKGALAVIGLEMTVNDAKARRELGYVGAMTRAAGLAEMTPISTAM